MAFAKKSSEPSLAEQIAASGETEISKTALSLRDDLADQRFLGREFRRAAQRVVADEAADPVRAIALRYRGQELMRRDQFADHRGLRAVVLAQDGHHIPGRQLIDDAGKSEVALLVRDADQGPFGLVDVPAIDQRGHGLHDGMHQPSLLRSNPCCSR